MRKLFVIAALSLALSIIAQAQDSPRTEIFGGYSYLRLDSDLNDDQDLNGYNASVNQTFFKKWLGFKADFSGHFGDAARGLGPGTDLNKFLFLFGPQITLRKFEKIQPFAHVLFGAARIVSDRIFDRLVYRATAPVEEAVGQNARLYLNLAHPPGVYGSPIG